MIRITAAQAIELTGSHKLVAAACGVHLATVYRWAHEELAVPEERARQIEAAIMGQGGDTPRVLRELADLIEAQVGADADGQISAAEAAMIEREGGQAIIEISRAILRAQERARKGGRT